MVDMFPYGSQQMPKGDDDLSAPFNFSQTIYFFGEPVTYVHVSINGYIAMGNDFDSFTPDPLTNHALVAPFFTDVDTRAAGNVYYGEERRSDLLEKAAKEVQKQSSPGFMPTILFIATWDGVGYYEKKSDKVNTFQAVIASNGFETHVLMYYKSINWTSPDNMNGQNGRLKGTNKTLLPILGVGDGKGREHRVCGQDEVTILGLPYTRGRLSDKNGLWTFIVSEPATTQAKKSAAGDGEKGAVPPEAEESADKPLPIVPTKSEKNSAGDGGAGDSLHVRHKDFPGVDLFGEMLESTFGAEGGTASDGDLGLLIKVPKGAVSYVFKIKSRVGFGGPFLLDEYIEAIGPPYFFTETTDPQKLKKEMTITLNHYAHDLPTREDQDSLLFVCFSSNPDSNGKYTSRVVQQNESTRFQFTDQFGKLMLKELNQNCHVMMVRRVKKIPHLSPEQASEEVMRRTLKFMVSFYNARVQVGDNLLPFTLFSMYPDHPIDRSDAPKGILKELAEDGLQILERYGEWCRNEKCTFDVKSTSVAVMASEHAGWEILESHHPEIPWADLWEQLKRRYTTKELVKCHKSLRMKFSKIPRSHICSNKCTVSANGFVKKVQTDVYLLWERVDLRVATEPALIKTLRIIMSKLANGLQVSNFAVLLGVEHSDMEMMRMQYGDIHSLRMDSAALDAFIIKLHDYISKNSLRLKCNETKVCEVLTQIRRGDLADKFSQKLRELEPKYRAASSKNMALYLREFDKKGTHNHALATEDYSQVQGEWRGHKRRLSE